MAKFVGDCHKISFYHCIADEIIGFALENQTTNDHIPAWKRYIQNLIAAEISSVSRYFTKLVQVDQRSEDNGYILEQILCPQKENSSLESLKAEPKSSENETLFLLNGNFNFASDIQDILDKFHSFMPRASRLVVVAYSPYLRWLYRLANILGFRKGDTPTTFLTRTDLFNIARVSHFDVVRVRPCGYFPWKLLGLGDIINKLMPIIPFVRGLGHVAIITLRPIVPLNKKASLSILIPARNEEENIEDALKRIPKLDGVETEIIFIEGHSTDHTWEEIQKQSEKYRDKFEIKSFKQSGNGKSDAVRLGAKEATKELIVILDADLTMPPELLPRFYGAYCEGHGDFINGNRLVYPMEDAAMRFLNRLGNVFFAKLLSLLLDQHLGDTLCGSKLFRRRDYERFRKWRDDFGDFDPFGDFELLFPASQIGIGIVDVPIPYKNRSYGQTNIHRFRDALLLLKMSLIGLLKLSLGKTKS